MDRPTSLLSAMLLSGVALMGADCATRVDAPVLIVDDPAHVDAPRDGRVVLVTIDGARWQDVLEGSDPALSGSASVPAAVLMPRTHALVAAHGVVIGSSTPGCGVVRTAGGSNVSLPGYLEIFTGHPSQCLDNECDAPAETVLDQIARVTGLRAASITSWDILGRAVTGGNAGVFVASGRQWPTGAPPPALARVVAAGEASAPYPGSGDYRPDAATAPIAIAYFEKVAPSFFHVGLGDTDELGHRNDYAHYLDALSRADDTIGQLADAIAEMGERGARTTVIVTPDHGRNDDFQNHGTLHPESGRTFIMAFGARVPQGAPCSSADVTLADIAPTIRLLMGLPRDIGPGAGKPIAAITGPP